VTTPANGTRERHCPYVGLQPFEEADHPYFFGRERDQRIVIANLLSSSLTVLYGGSGVGKSSVLMAGVLPQLHREREDTPVVVVREWSRQDFDVELKRRCIEDAWRTDPLREKPSVDEPLDEVLIACTRAVDRPILLILDQFEEYFLYHGGPTGPNSFEAQLARSINRDDVDARFMLSLREDGLAKLDRFRARIPNLLSNRLQLGHLNSDGARDAMRRPLEVWRQRYGEEVRIEDELVEALIKEVRTGQISTSVHGGSGTARDQSGQIEAPYLQQVLVRLWDFEMSSGSRVLRLSTLMDEFGGPQAIVRSHLNQVMTKELSAEEQAACASFFDRLVTPSGAKIACRASDLQDWAESSDRELVRNTLELLASPLLRILRTVASTQGDPGSTSYEIYHDVLAPAMLDWRQQYVAEQERKEADRIAQQEREEAARVAEEEKAEAVKRAKERAEKDALRREKVILKRWSVALAIATSIAILGWYFAYRESLRAESNRLAARSQIALAVDARQGLELALKAARKTTANPFWLLETTPAAEDALRRSIQSSRLDWTLEACGKVADLAMSSDGGLIAVGCMDGNAKVWDISGEKRVPRATLHHADDTVVRRLAFFSDGDRLITVGGDTIKLWSLDAPQGPLRTFVHGAPINEAFALDAKHRRIATASGSKWLKDTKREIKVWDLNGDFDEPITTIDTAGAWVKGVAFSSDGCCLATAHVKLAKPERKKCDDVQRISSTALWDIESGRELLNPEIKVASDAVTFTQDGKALIAAYRDTLVRLWRPINGELGGLLERVRELKEQAAQRRAATLAPAKSDEDRPATGEPTSEVTLSDRIFTDEISDAATFEVALPPIDEDQSTGAIAWPESEIPEVCIPPEETNWIERIFAGHTERVRNISISPDGKRLASAGADHLAKVWDLETGEHLLDLKGHTNWVEAARFSPDGHHLATASKDGTVKYWNISSHSGAVNTVAFSPDGKELVTGSSDQKAMVWRLGVHRPKLLHTLDAHTDQVYQVAVDPSGRFIATAGFDNKVRIWDFRSGKPIASLPHWDSLRDVTFSDPPGYVATAAGSGKGRLYELTDTGANQISEATHSVINTPDFVQASSVLLLPGQERWITAGYDGKLKLWDFTSPKAQQLGEIAIPDKAGRYIFDLALTPDGKQVAALSNRTGRVYVWPLEAFSDQDATVARTYDVPGTTCSAFAFSPLQATGLLAIACNDAEVHLLDVDTGEEVKRISIHQRPVVDVAFSPDGKLLASASLDGSFHVSPLDLDDLRLQACQLYQENLGTVDDSDAYSELGCPQLPPASAVTH